MCRLAEASEPVMARMKVIQKDMTAIMSIRCHECRRYGRPAAERLCCFATAFWKGASAIRVDIFAEGCVWELDVLDPGPDPVVLHAALFGPPSLDGVRWTVSRLTCRCFSTLGITPAEANRNSRTDVSGSRIRPVVTIRANISILQCQSYSECAGTHVKMMNNARRTKSSHDWK
jgi:hypothetical protein